MSNPLELPFGSPPGKVQDPSQSPGDGHEQSLTRANAPSLLQAVERHLPILAQNHQGMEKLVREG